MIEMQETHPLPRLALAQLSHAETPQEYYQHLKDISDATGMRLLFVYLSVQRKPEPHARPRLYKTRWVRERS